MALITFRSRAASAIMMLDGPAQRLLEIMGRLPGERGVITAAQVPQALQQLQAAVAAERAAGSAAPDDPDLPPALRPVELHQRAYPLLEMLRAAAHRGVDVTWGI